MRGERECRLLRGINRRSLGALACLAAGLCLTGTALGFAAAGGVSEAKVLVAKDQGKLSTFKAPGPAFDGTAARGKSVWLITQLATIPFNNTVIQGFSEAAKAAGVKVTVVDGKGQVSEFGRAVSQAIAQDADAIVLFGIPSALVSAQLNRPEAAGVKVITASTHDPGPPLPGEPKNVVAEATHCFSCAGRMMAHYFVADSQGRGEGLVITASDVGGISVKETQGITSETKRLCPGCKLKLVDFPSAQWTTITARFPAILRANPNATYVLPLYDGMATFLMPAIRQAGAANRVKIVTFNGTKSVLQSLKRGDIVAADVGQAATQEGWGVFDQTLRALSGAKPVKDIFVPERLFTRANIGSINLNASEDTSWYTKSNFRVAYKNLWRLR